MKNETMMDILMIVAVVLVMVGAAAIWGLYSLGASIPVLCLVGLGVIVSVGVVGGKMYELADEGDDESNKEDRL